MLSVPPEKLPEEWKNEERLDSLFSPFRSRTVNPKDWESKISSWQKLIRLYCSNNEIFCFKLSELNKAFIRNGRPPSCLSVVVDEMLKSGDIQPVETFLSKSSRTWGAWATDLLIKKPLNWSLNTLRKSLFSEIKEDRSFVHIGVVQEEAEKLLARVPDKSKSKLITLGDLLKTLEKDSSQVRDVKLLLHYLVNEQKVDVIKLENNSDELTSFLIKIGTTKVQPISEVDIGVHVLEENEILFTKHIEDLEDEIAFCVKEAKTHLGKGHRQLAKTCLRKKHEMEKRLTRKINALHNVQVLLERIRDVHTDAEVWKAYKHALSAFNTTFKETGLSEDAVEDTMLKIGDMLEVHDDIQSAMSKPVHNTDDEELEDELAELMKPKESSDKEEPLDDTGEVQKELEKLVLDLPDVPISNVSLTQESLGGN